MESYHQAVARRLEAITDNQLEITDIYSLLDWLHNIYNRYTQTHTHAHMLNMLVSTEFAQIDQIVPGPVGSEQLN